MELLRKYLLPKMEGMKRIVCWPCHRSTWHTLEKLYDEETEQSYDLYKCSICNTEQRYYEKGRILISMKKAEEGG